MGRQITVTSPNKQIIRSQLEPGDLSLHIKGLVKRITEIKNHLKKHTQDLLFCQYKNKHPLNVYLLFKLLLTVTHCEQKIHLTTHRRKANKCNLSYIKNHNQICTRDK